MNSPALPVGTGPQGSGSSYAGGQDAVSAESSFLAQRDPGPKPHSLWGLNATEYGNLLSHQPRRSPARLAGWSLSSLCRQQLSPSRPWVPPESASPPWPLSSGPGQSRAGAPVLEGREERPGLRERAGGGGWGAG